MSLLSVIICYVLYLTKIYYKYTNFLSVSVRSKFLQTWGWRFFRYTLQWSFHSNQSLVSMTSLFGKNTFFRRKEFIGVSLPSPVDWNGGVWCVFRDSSRCHRRRSGTTRTRRRPPGVSSSRVLLLTRTRPPWVPTDCRETVETDNDLLMFHGVQGFWSVGITPRNCRLNKVTLT